MSGPIVIDPHEEIPEHVRRIIARDGEIEFTPPSFERWLGRLQMLRTLAAMGAFLVVWLAAYDAGMGWEAATIRGIIASIVFHFFAWATGLFIFGELYDAEVRLARRELEEKERERARRIEAYYRDRLRAQDAIGRNDGQVDTMPGSNVPSLGDPLTEVVPGYTAYSPPPSQMAA